MIRDIGYFVLPRNARTVEKHSSLADQFYDTSDIFIRISLQNDLQSVLTEKNVADLDWINH